MWQQYVRDDVAKGINILGPIGALGSPFADPGDRGKVPTQIVQLENGG